MNKQELIRKLVRRNNELDRSKNFWGKEMFLLNKMLQEMPNMDFWELGSFEQVDSLAIYLASDFQMELLREKYKRFSIRKLREAKKLRERIELNEQDRVRIIKENQEIEKKIKALTMEIDQIYIGEKSGEDYDKKKKPKSQKDFLNG